MILAYKHPVRWHSGVVISTVTSQQGGPGFKCSWLCLHTFTVMLVGNAQLSLWHSSVFSLFNKQLQSSCILCPSQRYRNTFNWQNNFMCLFIIPLTVQKRLKLGVRLINHSKIGCRYECDCEWLVGLYMSPLRWTGPLSSPEDAEIGYFFVQLNI